ncbi:Reverse transcriptase domain-containing protein, partial [Aphis craccivora]
MEGDILTFTNVGNRIIRLKKDQPSIHRRPYRLPHAQQDEINTQIKKLDDNDIIEKSRSPWNSPILLVRNKIDNSGKQKFRIVVDFRALNEVTINEFYPLPNITEILDQLGQCQLFYVLDLSSGFYQIKLEKESRELIAFSTNQCH